MPARHPAIAGIARAAMNNLESACLLHGINLPDSKKAAAHSLASTLHILSLK
jgi:hypothetical protein